MTVEEVLSAYHRLGNAAGYVSKLGLRFDAARHAGLRLLAQTELEPGFVDATGSAGYVAWRRGGEATVLEPSAAALRCAKVTFKGNADVTLAAGASWDLPAARSMTMCLLPATDKGTARVRAELQGAQRSLREGGYIYLVMHKDQGAKRYEKLAGEIFDLEVLARDGGWRLSRAVKRNATAAPPGMVEMAQFEAAGLGLEAEPGVFAAGKLDPGTALLLDSLDMAKLRGRRVLDLGCGYGLLALKASLAGAAVTACDDDLLAVRSTYRNAKRYGLDVRCLHSDVDSALKRERFDAVLTNPPFHVGKEVRPLLPKAFLAAAIKHLRPGGTLTLAANRALAYEKVLARWAEVEEVGRDTQFKVLRAVKR